MPIYEYSCPACHEKFERLAKSMSGGQSANCPKCGKKAPRTLSVFAVATEGAKRSASPEPGMCGRCGGPGPCGMN